METILNTYVEDEPEQSVELGKLHTAGVELRNRGERIKWYKPATWGKLAAWVKEYEEWKAKVVEVLMQLSAAKAQRIQTLNRIPTGGGYRFWTAKNKSHRRHLRTLERRLELLEEIIGQYAGLGIWRKEG